MDQQNNEAASQQQSRPPFHKRFAEGAKPWKSSIQFTIFLAVNILIIGIVLLIYREEIGYVGMLFILLSLYVVPTFTTGLISAFSTKAEKALGQGMDKITKDATGAAKSKYLEIKEQREQAAYQKLSQKYAQAPQSAAQITQQITQPVAQQTTQPAQQPATQMVQQKGEQLKNKN